VALAPPELIRIAFFSFTSVETASATPEFGVSTTASTLSLEAARCSSQG
jgi:hypothetical protein